MTLAPARPEHAPPDPGGAEPTVLAVLVTRRDPGGLADLLRAVLTQSLTPDSVLVLDRTEGRVLPPSPEAAAEADAADGAGAARGGGGSEDTALLDADGAAATDAAAALDDGLALDNTSTPPDTSAPTHDVGPGDASSRSGGWAASGASAPAANRPPAIVADDVVAIVQDVAPGHGIPVWIRPVDPRTPLRAAVHDALLTLDGADSAGGSPGGSSSVAGWASGSGDSAAAPTLAWVLPVGTTPEPGALVALVDTWRRSPSTGVVGPKHVDARDPHLLRALAIHTTRGGRLLDRPTPGTPDQGQYDRMTDALAVPLAGSLLERELVLGLGGWERSFGDLGADLDFGWRAQESGRRVVVVPTARVAGEPGVDLASSSPSARRRQARRVALTRAAWWAAVPLALWMAVSSLLAAVGLLLLKRPRSAWVELSSLAALDPFRGVAARWRTRHRRVVRRRDLRALFEPRRAVLSAWGDAVHDALVAPRPPMGDEEPDLNPRSWFAKVVRHPGVLAAVGAATVSIVAGRSLGPSLLTAAGSGLTGGELVGNRADAITLWHSWSDGWSGAGLGGPDPVGPHVPLLAGPAWVVDHLPVLPSPASPAGFVVAVLVILGMPLAAASAYLAFRTMVSSRWVRGLGAFTWATTGVAAASVAQGRLGALVALVLLPLLASGFWLLATRRSTATSAFATALAAVLLGAFVPLLLALACTLALVLALVRSRVRLHAIVVALVPLALLAPWLVPAAEASWPSLVGGVGMAQWGGSAPAPWQLALLNPGGEGTPPLWAGLPLVAVAVLALWRGRSWGSASTTLAVLAPVLLALALVAPAVRIGTVPAGVDGAGAPITLWSGTMLLPLALVVVLALVRGVDGIRLRRATDGTRTPAGGTHTAAGTAAAGGPHTVAGPPAAAGIAAADGTPLAVGIHTADETSAAGGPGASADGSPVADGPHTADGIHTAAGSPVASGTHIADGTHTAAGTPAAEGALAPADGTHIAADGTHAGDGASAPAGGTRTAAGTPAADGTRLAHAMRWIAVTASVLAVLVGAVGVAWAGLGSELAPWRDPRPAVSVEQSEGAFATRALFVLPGDRGAGYRLVGREAAELVRGLPTVADADGSLATRVSDMLADPSKGPALFDDTATDLLAVRAGAAPEVTRRLDATEGLQRIAPRDGWEMWRASPSGAADGLVAPPRLRVTSAEGTLLVPTTGQHGATSTSVEVPAEGRLVVAEAPGWAERAVVDLDGEVLQPLSPTGPPTYTLPPGSGHLTVTLVDPSRWWHLGQVVAFLVLGFLAIPFGRRASRVRRA